MNTTILEHVYVINRDETDMGDAWDFGLEAIRETEAKAYETAKGLAEARCDELERDRPERKVSDKVRQLKWKVERVNKGYKVTNGIQDSVVYTIEKWPLT